MRPARSWSLQARITAAALAAVAVAGVAAGLLLLAVVERDARREVDAELRDRADLVVRRPARGLGRSLPPGRGGALRRDERLLAGTGSFAQVAVDGVVVEQRGDVPVGVAPPPAQDGLSTVDIGGRSWRSLAVSLGGPGDTRVQVLSSLEPVEERVAQIRRQVAVVGLGALALTGLAAWWLVSLALRPLERLRARAARIGDAEDLRTPLPDDDGPLEVRSLAATLNAMLARLEASTAALQRALEATRRFAADAGHELRTPLTGLRASIDALERNPDLPVERRRALVRDIAAEQERIVHLLEGLQALARGDAAESLPRSDVELGDVLEAALFGARRRHPEVAFELDAGTAEATVDGWPDGLRLLVDNLLDNAALHGRPRGRVRAGLDRRDGTVMVRVEDDGPGIPAGERARVFEPFARGREVAAPGTGLGLAIVAQQAALHGGEVRLEDSGLGGLAVLVSLPVGGDGRAAGGPAAADPPARGPGDPSDRDPSISPGAG